MRLGLDFRIQICTNFVGEVAAVESEPWLVHFNFCPARPNCTKITHTYTRTIKATRGQVIATHPEHTTFITNTDMVIGRTVFANCCPACNVIGTAMHHEKAHKCRSQLDSSHAFAEVEACLDFSNATLSQDFSTQMRVQIRTMGIAHAAPSSIKP